MESKCPKCGASSWNKLEQQVAAATAERDRLMEFIGDLYTCYTCGYVGNRADPQTDGDGGTIAPSAGSREGMASAMRRTARVLQKAHRNGGSRMSTPRTTEGYQEWTRNGDPNSQIAWTDGDKWLRIGCVSCSSTKEMLRDGSFGDTIDPERERRLVEAMRTMVRRYKTAGWLIEDGVIATLAEYGPPRHLPTEPGLWSALPTGETKWTFHMVRSYSSNRGHGLEFSNGVPVQEFKGEWGCKLEPGPAAEATA